MTATTVGDFGATAADQVAIDTDAAQQQPLLRFSPLVRNDHLQKCYLLARSEIVARRAMRYKMAKLFYRINVNKNTIKGGDMAGGENLTLAVRITWGVEKVPTRPEFTNMVIAFMMDAVVAHAMYGGIPWYERRVESRFEPPIVFDDGSTKAVRYRIPHVAKCGLFKITQTLDPANMQYVSYALENTQIQTHAHIHPGGTQTKPFPQTTLKEIDGLQRGALATIGGPTDEARRRLLGKGRGGQKRYKNGVYFFPTEEPDIDGTLASAASTALAINEFVEMKKACSVTADSIGSYPMLVTQHATTGGSAGGGGGGMTAAQHLITVGDLSNKRAVDQMNDDAREAFRQQQYNQARSTAHYASQVQTARATITDMLTRRNRRLTTRTFYDSHHYDVPAGQQVANQQMPIQPSDLQAWEQARQELVAAAFDTSRTVLMGESANAKAGAEINRDLESQQLEFEANQLATATQEILNTIYAQRETRELQAKYTLMVMQEEEFYASNPDRLDKEGREKRRAELTAKMESTQQDILQKDRYHISFAPAARADIDSVLKVAMRGVLPREIEAALLAHAIGVDPTEMELQPFPDPYLKPPDPLAAAAISAGQPGPKSTPKSGESSKK